MNLKRVAKWKVYFDRSRMYIGYLQFFMILLVLFESYKETSFGIWLYSHSIITIPLILILFLGGSIIIGYLDKQFIRPYEQGEITSTNPHIMEIKDKINEIHEKL